MQALDALWPETGKRGELRQFARQFAFELLQKIEFAARQNGGDLAREVFADAGQIVEVFALLQQRADALRQLFENARGATIGARSKRIVAFDIEQIGRFIEHGGDFGILNRHRAFPAAR